MEEAARLLGRPYALCGVIQRGKQLGRKLDFPTANLLWPEGKAIPPKGVYAARVYVDEAWYIAAVNVGTHPTAPGGPPTIEANLLDYEGGSLYGHHMRLLLCGFVLGGPWGLAVGFVAPLLRSVLFGMPPMFPVAISMAFELATYGAVAGFLYRKVQHTLPMIYATLVTSMVAGRLVWGAVRFVLAGGELPDEAMISMVREALSDETVRPLTDRVDVAAPETVDYAVSGRWYLRRSDAVLLSGVTAAVAQAVEDWRLWQRSQPGRDINPTRLIAAVQAAGAKRVELDAPAFRALEATQVARETDISLLFGGLEDE